MVLPQMDQPPCHYIQQHKRKMILSRIAGQPRQPQRRFRNRHNYIFESMSGSLQSMALR